MSPLCVACRTGGGHPPERTDPINYVIDGDVCDRCGYTSGSADPDTSGSADPESSPRPGVRRGLHPLQKLPILAVTAVLAVLVVFAADVDSTGWALVVAVGMAAVYGLLVTTIEGMIRSD